MRVVEHAPDGRPDEVYPVPEPHSERPVIVYTPFRRIVLGRSHELHIDLSESSEGSRAVSMRFHTANGHGRPLKAERPVTFFPSQLPSVVAALTDAAAAIGAIPPPAAHHVDTSGTIPAPAAQRRGNVGPEHSHA